LHPRQWRHSPWEYIYRVRVYSWCDCEQSWVFVYIV
jgi:hypothetical protein